MNLENFDAPEAPQPAGGYSQAMGQSDAKRILYISGQIPATADGHVPDNFPAQAELVWKNIELQLAAAGMTRHHCRHLRRNMVT